MHNFNERVLPPLANVPPLELASFLVTVFFLSLIWEAGAQKTKCSIRSETLSDRSCVVGCLLFSQTDMQCFGNASIAVCCSSCVIDTDGFIRRRRFTVVVRLWPLSSQSYSPVSNPTEHTWSYIQNEENTNTNSAHEKEIYRSTNHKCYSSISMIM